MKDVSKAFGSLLFYTRHIYEIDIYAYVIGVYGYIYIFT